MGIFLGLQTIILIATDRQKKKIIKIMLDRAVKVLNPSAEQELVLFFL